MWIRSQNERVLVNVNDICFYKMKKDSKTIYQFRCYGYGTYYILGEYSKEEKALKVMDMIHDQSLKSEFVFQMPKDEEVE